VLVVVGELNLVVLGEEENLVVVGEENLVGEEEKSPLLRKSSPCRELDRPRSSILSFSSTPAPHSFLLPHISLLSWCN